MCSPYNNNGLGWDKEWNKDLSITMSIQCVAPTVRMVWRGTRSETRIYLWPCPFNVWPLQWEWFGVGQGVKQGSIYDLVHSMCSPYSENGFGMGQGVKQGSIYHNVHSMCSPYNNNGLGWDKEWNKDISITMSIQCVAPTVRMVWDGTRSETRIYLSPCSFNV